MVKVKGQSIVSITTDNGCVDFDFSTKYLSISICKLEENPVNFYGVRREDLMKVVSLMIQYDRMKSRPQGQ